MRLVDLDSKDFENHLETGGEEFARGIRFVWDTLNNQPTVDAIPVEWLCNYALSTNNTAIFFPMFLRWYKEKENETNGRR